MTYEELEKLVEELKERIEQLERKLAGIIETHSLWDGS